MPASASWSRQEELVRGLSSQDSNVRLKSLRELKNQIIGSKAKKLSFIKLGAVPRVVAILAGEHDAPLLVQSAAAVGSFACGIDVGVRAVLDSGVLPHLLLTLRNEDKKVVEAGLRSLRMILHSSLLPSVGHSLLSESTLQLLLGLLLFPNDDVAEVAAILIARCCQTAEQQNAVCTGGGTALVGMLARPVKTREAALDAMGAIMDGNRETAKLMLGLEAPDLLGPPRQKALTVPQLLLQLLSEQQQPRTRLFACRCLVIAERSVGVQRTQNEGKSGALMAAGSVICSSDSAERLNQSATTSAATAAAASATYSHDDEMDLALEANELMADADVAAWRPSQSSDWLAWKSSSWSQRSASATVAASSSPSTRHLKITPRSLPSQKGPLLRSRLLKCLVDLLHQPGEVGELAPRVVQQLVADRHDLQQEAIRLDGVTKLAALLHRRHPTQSSSMASSKRSLHSNVAPFRSGSLAVSVSSSSTSVANNSTGVISSSLESSSLPPLQLGNVLDLLAVLCSKEEGSRRQLLDLDVLPLLLLCMKSRHGHVQAAACRCLLSMSRSVKKLRSGLSELRVANELLTLVQGEGPEVKAAAAAALSNIVIGITPKTALLARGFSRLMAALMEADDSSLPADSSPHSDAPSSDYAGREQGTTAMAIDTPCSLPGRSGSNGTAARCESSGLGPQQGVAGGNGTLNMQSAGNGEGPAAMDESGLSSVGHERKQELQLQQLLPPPQQDQQQRRRRKQQQQQQQLQHGLRVSAVCCVANFLFESPHEVKQRLVKELRSATITACLKGPDPDLKIQSLGLIRNLVHGSVADVDLFLKWADCAVVEAVKMVLEEDGNSDDHRAEATFILSNIACGSEAHKEMVIDFLLLPNHQMADAGPPNEANPGEDMAGTKTSMNSSSSQTNEGSSSCAAASRQQLISDQPHEPSSDSPDEFPHAPQQPLLGRLLERACTGTRMAALWCIINLTLPGFSFFMSRKNRLLEARIDQLVSPLLLDPCTELSERATAALQQLH